MCRVPCQRQVGEQCVQRAVAASAHRADEVRAAAPVCQRQVGAWQRARFGKLGQCSVVQPGVSSCASANTVKVALQCSQLKTVQCYARITQVFHALDGQWVRRVGSVSILRLSWFFAGSGWEVEVAATPVRKLDSSQTTAPSSIDSCVVL